METGEPSLDGRGEPGAEGQTKDITPEVSEKMTRPELEALAREKGLADAEIEAAPNKGALVEMIVGGTTPTPEADAEPAIDPSANL
ncbi:MAG: hypothetical protein BGO51_15565 [Rhodospirillales bacterium 69-11]|nr:MAG: hypothetical protein BGO51_15565 [Rhodospirillales bacterium 69-11]